ncbi:hypothetical protein BDN70DRAFT_187299 [Pholiota conissans]|uniref:BTB domain-containing protein n=1 Tax=Pholiota conissans TaxID=109636 RepID=A0A9P6CY18_9AGAR|nr:hypothetical protein BDN70DRAFT_187299 [Pholiota conissans]
MPLNEDVLGTLVVHSEDNQSIDHPVIDINDSKPHPALWFDDGSLVIQASSVSYRIHRSVICKQSTVFADMVTSPQPGGSSGDAGNLSKDALWSGFQQKTVLPTTVHV